MALLKLVTEPDPRYSQISDRLRQRCAPIAAFDDALLNLERDLYETLDAEHGVGLAAPQVGVLRQICVIRIPAGYEYEDSPETRLTLINPEVMRAGGQEMDVEGCLSFPELIGDVPRYTSITVRSHTTDGKRVKIKAHDYLARVMQHEIDHLNGILFFDRMVDWSTLRYPAPAEDEATATPLAE